MKLLVLLSLSSFVLADELASPSTDSEATVSDKREPLKPATRRHWLNGAPGLGEREARLAALQHAFHQAQAQKHAKEEANK